MKLNYFALCHVVVLFTTLHSSVFANELTKEPYKPGEMLESTASIPLTENQSVKRLGDVKKIFVASLGNSEGSELIRQNIINSLFKSGIVSVVDSPNEADAVLTGIGQVSAGFFFTRDIGIGSTSESATVVVRLVGTKNQILWTGEGRPGYLSADKVISSVADNVVKTLTKAIKKDREGGQLGCNH